jgi:hypothetical protein
MNSFSNAMIQRHLGQTETVLPRPVGLYEPVRNAGMENPDQIEQNLTDTGQDVMQFSLHESERSMQPPEVQTPYPLSANEWPRQEQRNTQTDSMPTDQKTLQIIPPLLTSEFQLPVQSILASVPSANTQRSTDNDSNSHDFQTQKMEQIAQRHLIQTQIERRLESQVEPLNKVDNAVDIVQPTSPPINSRAQIQANQSGQITVPPKMNQTPALPVVKVSIGRIEVKAVVQTPPQPAKSSPLPKPRMSLDEYLKKQDNQTK